MLIRQDRAESPRPHWRFRPETESTGGSLSVRRRDKEAFMGFFLGLFSSATFGLIPLFTLPLIHDGVSPASVLF